MSEMQNDGDPEIARMTEVLLGSWRTDAAPSGAKRATMAALGVGLATTATVASSGAMAIVKALAGGALVGVLAVGTITYVQRTETPKGSVAAAPLPAAVTEKAPSRSDVAPSAPSIAPEGEVEVDRGSAITPILAAATARSRDDGSNATNGRASVPAEERSPLAVAGATPEPSPAGPSPLAREIALLDDSRAALARGDASGALKLLDRHSVEFARGTLGPEAVVVRVEALLRLGDDGSALAVASQFAKEHPDDSHLARLRSLFTHVEKPTSTGGRP